MTSFATADLLVTGLGITAAIGQGRAAFGEALFAGRHAFDVMKRPGRQIPATAFARGGESVVAAPFLGAEIGVLSMPAAVTKASLRTLSYSAQVAVATLDEAWSEARLDAVDPPRIGLVVGGSNFQQRELVQAQQQFASRAEFLRPTYGMAFMDTDLCAACTASHPIAGLALTVGGASASGQLAVIQAVQAVRSGQVDVCIALGALMDLSFWEFQGLRSLGAMGSARYADAPALASRPFDQDRDGFIYGESCAAVVIESAGTATRRGVGPYARIAGWSIRMDRNRNPNPSLEGEMAVIDEALHMSGLAGRDIDYVNPHGSGSVLGDDTELAALRRCGVTQAHLNATKALTGHGLTAAGAVELVATLLQMRAGRLHPTRNLDTPIDYELRWVPPHATPHDMRSALNLSFGFGGINTAVCIRAL